MEEKRKSSSSIQRGLDTSFTVMYLAKEKGMKCMLLVQTRVVSVRSS